MSGRIGIDPVSWYSEYTDRSILTANTPTGTIQVEIQ
jgi:hypothetical protein